MGGSFARAVGQEFGEVPLEVPRAARLLGPKSIEGVAVGVTPVWFLEG
jgi:hypothetical protein